MNADADRFPDQPLVSVFTPTYKTGTKIHRPLRSLQAQSYSEWEWVIFDDSPDGGRTFEQMSALAFGDPRIVAYRADRPSGNIGEVKRRACGLARGRILVELDHDDELTPGALAAVVEAYRRFPDAGFFYTDCAEVFESGQSATYGETWAYGYGSYRQESLNGTEFQVTNYPDVNAKTIRHIVGVPNHLRAWTREGYQAAGGHNPEVHVCDDYELIIRTFLTTRMVHIQRFGYIQYHNDASSGNTQRHRNAEIQRLVRYFRNAYNDRIHERFVELGVDDFIWREGGELDWNVPNPADTPIANYRFR
jgi:glycosyltransferase involved in cell wall biosynthesis